MKRAKSRSASYPKPPMTASAPTTDGSRLDLSVELHGLQFPNPFIVGSGPPGTHAAVIAKALDEGWGGVVSKTMCLDHTRINNVYPRYSRMRVGQEIIGWENIELISDRPFADWLDDFRKLQQKPRKGRLIASIMEAYSRDAWHEIVERTQATGVDALELNLSCPHGLPEQRMGSAIGQDPEMVAQVCAWVRERATVPVWAKLTPNVTDIRHAGRAALSAGCHGLCATNTILSVMGINLETLRPEPTVEGYSIAGGYSGRAIRPISLRMNMELAKMIQAEGFSGSLIGLGGVETGEDAAQYILVGANAVQVCTGVMIRGYRMIRDLISEMEAFMFRHGFTKVSDFKGKALPFFTTHADLVARQRPQTREEEPGIEIVVPVKDADWRSETFVAQSDALISR